MKLIIAALVLAVGTVSVSDAEARGRGGSKSLKSSSSKSVSYGKKISPTADADAESAASSSRPSSQRKSRSFYYTSVSSGNYGTSGNEYSMVEPGAYQRIRSKDAAAQQDEAAIAKDMVAKARQKAKPKAVTFEAPVGSSAFYMVYEIQKELSDIGYFQASPTGVFNARLHRSIKAFQKDAGLQTTGLPSYGLLSAIKFYGL